MQSDLHIGPWPFNSRKKQNKYIKVLAPHDPHLILQIIKHISSSLIINMQIIQELNMRGFFKGYRFLWRWQVYQRSLKLIEGEGGCPYLSTNSANILEQVLNDGHKFPDLIGLLLQHNQLHSLNLKEIHKN